MKTNLPVTQTERFLEPGKPIVTKTDLKGQITYANESFIRISGFEPHELIGANHNVVRHPDMPPAAFADLWHTVKANEPWRGLVKNRAKNGDFYWVEAFVTPILENGQKIGYMSVRTAPDKNEVARVEQLYREIREGRATMQPTPRLKPLAVAGKIVWALIALIIALIVAGVLTQGNVAWGLFGLAGVAALGFGLWLQSALLQPLNGLQAALSAVDEGQLARRIVPQGGLMDALFMQVEAMRIHQRAMFADVLVAAREVAKRSQELDESIHVIENTSGNQTEQVMQVAAAMEQMSVSVTEISNNTEQSLAASQATDSAAQSSLTAMHESTQDIQQVVQVVEKAQATIREMYASITHIAEFAKLIKEIADQTNLLALNAAIEAARAGESGRGFAVVADEVRKLAERTAQTTADITQSVNAVQLRANEAVENMEAATGAVTRGTLSIADTADSLGQISTASQTATELAQDIRRMLQQQSDASHEVAVSMEALAALVDKNHHTIGDVGNAMTGLRSTSTELHALVKHLESAL